jgi:hypothetical protein
MGSAIPDYQAVFDVLVRARRRRLQAIMRGVLYQIIDVWQWRRWSTAFGWIDSNAIALYLLGNVLNYHETVATRFVGGDVADFFDSHVTAGTGHLSAAARDRR